MFINEHGQRLYVSIICLSLKSNQYILMEDIFWRGGGIWIRWAKFFHKASVEVLWNQVHVYASLLKFEQEKKKKTLSPKGLVTVWIMEDFPRHFTVNENQRSEQSNLSQTPLVN